MTTMPTDAAAPVDQAPWGVLAEFENVDTLCQGTAAIREAGFVNFEVHTPFPVHRQVKALPPTQLPWIVLAAGLTGLTTGLLLTWYASATMFDWVPLVNLQGYPTVISGKPLWSLPAFIPVIFELTVLFSAFGAVFGMLALNRLPKLHHPLFASQAFRRATQDRFFIAVEATDPKFDHFRLDEMLRDHGALNVERIEQT